MFVLKLFSKKDLVPFAGTLFMFESFMPRGQENEVIGLSLDYIDMLFGGDDDSQDDE